MTRVHFASLINMCSVRMYVCIYVLYLLYLYEAEPPPYAPVMIDDSQTGGYRSVSEELLVVDLLVRGRGRERAHLAAQLYLCLVCTYRKVSTA
jgi:hypothetical protein